MPHLPDDVTLDELAALQMPPGPATRKSNIVRKGQAPIFVEHGKARGRAHVFVSNGRWRILCPTCHYRSPAYDARGERITETRCARCHNSAAGKRIFDVLWPTPEQQARIEAVLLCRPEQATRNWHPGESLGMLVVENVAHGCAVPELPIAVTVQDELAVLGRP
jgi:hypothetical protein